MFTSLEESVAAIEAEFVRSWDEFATVIGLTPAHPAYETSKKIFRQGYISAVAFIAESMADMTNPTPNEPNDP
jgi:hypothetical protein